MNKKRLLELERVSINLPSNLVKDIKEYAELVGLNYTSTYTILLFKGLDILKNKRKD